MQSPKKHCKLVIIWLSIELHVRKTAYYWRKFNKTSIHRNCSINGFDVLNHEFLQRLDYLPDIICLSETKIKNLPTVNLSLTGYRSIEHADSQTAAGEVGIYISDNYSSKTIGKNTLNCNCEDIWIQISDFNSNQIFYLGVIYRHPNSNILNFILALNNKLIQLGKHKYYVVGNFNINIDYKNRSVNSDMYLNMISNNGAFLPIDKHTRVINNSRSIIDHVITNDISNTIFPCVFLSDISDYFPIAIIVEQKNKQQDNSRSSSSSSFEGYPLQVRHKQEWGRGFILLLHQTAVLPGSNAGSDVIKPASSFVIQNRQTSCSMWCPMYRARC